MAEEDEEDYTEQIGAVRDGTSWYTGAHCFVEDPDGCLYMRADCSVTFPAGMMGGALNTVIYKVKGELVIKAPLPNNSRQSRMAGVKYLPVKRDYPNAYRKCVRCGDKNPSEAKVCRSCHKDPNNKD